MESLIKNFAYWVMVIVLVWGGVLLLDQSSSELRTAGTIALIVGVIAVVGLIIKVAMLFKKAQAADIAAMRKLRSEGLGLPQKDKKPPEAKDN